jgi:lysozyme
MYGKARPRAVIVQWPDRVAIFAVAEPLIMHFEEFRSRPYLCAAGRPTIGYGSTKYPDGRKVTLADQPCSDSEARVYLEFSMRRVLQDLETDGAVTRAPDINQASAFLSLGYNIGVGAHDGRKGDLADSTLLECFNRGDISGAAHHFLDWNKARENGILQQLPGLTNRRKIEQALFLKAA